MRVRNRK